jgi:single-stranded DNA-binding protein
MEVTAMAINKVIVIGNLGANPNRRLRNMRGRAI